MSTIKKDITTRLEDSREIVWSYGFNPIRFQFKSQVFKQLIPEDSIVIDIGAHDGFMSLMFESCVGKKGKVLAFEPNPTTFEHLKRYIELNSLKIIPYNLAVTPENKKYTFNYTDAEVWGTATNGGFFDNLEGSNGLKQVHSQQVEVNGVNIIDFIYTNYKEEIDKIKFIKIDTEGNDKEIIKTLGPLIERSKPLLLVEAFKQLSSSEILDYFESIKKHDYEIYDVSPRDDKLEGVGPLTLEEFEYNIKYINGNGNFLCVHKDDLLKHGLPTTISNKTSIIVVDRNDGSKSQEDFINKINSMLGSFDEVVYVDWNSPKGSYLTEIKEYLPKTNKIKHFSIHPDIISQLLDSVSTLDVSLISKSLAFNIGLRRTDAEWVVFSSMDTTPPTKEVIDERLSKSNKNTLYNFTEDFQLASKNLWYKIKGGEENMLWEGYINENIIKKVSMWGFKTKTVHDITPHPRILHKSLNKQNSVNEWVNNFNQIVPEGLEFYEFFISRNSIFWGLSNIKIEYEFI